MLIISLLLSEFVKLNKHFIGSPISTFLSYHFVNVCVSCKNGFQLVEYTTKSQISKNVERSDGRMNGG